MKRIDPVWKFTGLLIPSILLLFFYAPVLNGFVFALSLAAALLGGCRKKTLLAVLMPVLLSAAALYFTGMRFPAQPHLALNEKLFADGAVWNGLQLASRVLVFSGLGILFTLTTDRMEMIRSVRQQWKLPAKFAYGLLAACGMIPTVMLEYRKARMAFRARGLSPAPWSPKLLKPLLVKTVRWSEALAAAMESKGFGGKNRTEYYVVTVKTQDILFPVVTTALFFLGVFLDRAVMAYL